MGRPRSRYGVAVVESQVQTWALVTDGPCKHKKCAGHGAETMVVISTLLSLICKRITVDEAVDRLHCYGGMG